jgi:hypothetical protein
LNKVDLDAQDDRRMIWLDYASIGILRLRKRKKGTRTAVPVTDMSMAHAWCMQARQTAAGIAGDGKVGRFARFRPEVGLCARTCKSKIS